jgi:hypothetical protein
MLFNEYGSVTMKHSRVEYFLFFFLVAALSFALWVYALGWSQPILDSYGFRQTQTAITCLYTDFWKNFFNYQTPVLGPPWSIPFEFPLYQVLVKEVSRLIPLDQSGRLVSISFALFSVFPIWKISNRIFKAVQGSVIVTVLYLLSPVYLFWSRTFMIESTALFFSLMFTWTAIEWEGVSKKGYRWLLGMALFGTLASLVKITTFLMFGVGASLYLFYSSNFQIKKSIAPALVIGSTLLVGILWTKLADYEKSLNPLADFITSRNLRSWNFGTFEQKTDFKTWQLFLNKRVPEAIGDKLFLWGILICQLICTKRERILSWFLVSLYFLTLVTFTNLHFVHSYYQYSCAIFLVAALAIAISAVTRMQPILGLVALLVVSGFLVNTYFRNYYKSQTHPDSYIQALGAQVAAQTSPDDVLLIYGLDWSSELPYYAGRRSLMDRGMGVPVPGSPLGQSFILVKEFGLKFGAMIVCDRFKSQTEFMTKRANSLDFVKVYEDSRCVMYGRSLASK